MPASPHMAQLIGPTQAPGEPELRAVAINTLFGAFARKSTSGELGNATDSKLLAALRKWSDCVLVGAGTVAAEQYGPSATPIAVVTRSLELDPSLPIFGTERLIIVAPERSLADATCTPTIRTLENLGATIVSSGDGSAASIVRALRNLGFARILCEGGPHLYAQMLDANLIDVLHVTVDVSVGSQDGPWGLELDRNRNYVRRFEVEDATVDQRAMIFTRLRRVR